MPVAVVAQDYKPQSQTLCMSSQEDSKLGTPLTPFRDHTSPTPNLEHLNSATVSSIVSEKPIKNVKIGNQPSLEVKMRTTTTQFPRSYTKFMKQKRREEDALINQFLSSSPKN